MRVAFVGKGGSGKTTAAAAFSRQLTERGHPVLAFDADINQHLAHALGHRGAHLRGLGSDLPWLKDYLRGTNPRIPRPEAMIKTTPPGRGSRLVTFADDDPVLRRYSADVDGVRVIVSGALADDDIGVSCYHSKTGPVELLLHHLIH